MISPLNMTRIPSDLRRTFTYIACVGVLVLRLVWRWHLTVRAIVLTVVIGSAMVCYNH